MLFHREPYGEPGAFPRLGGYGDPASHALYNGFADRQPQSGTLLERVNFIKSVEYLLCHVRRDAATGIRDEKPNFLSVAGKRITEVYMAFFSEFQCVADQVFHHLPQAQGIRVDPDVVGRYQQVESDACRYSVRIFSMNVGQYVSERLVCFAKLLQKSEMRKDIVIELSYKGFG